MYSDCEWITILGQGVPAHIGTPTFGYGYEAGDPYGEFLPPPVPVVDDDDDDGERLRAIVVVRDTTEKAGQRYVDPLLMLSGDEYAALSFQSLHDRICDALREGRPKLIAEVIDGDDSVLIFEEGLEKKRPDDVEKG